MSDDMFEDKNIVLLYSRMCNRYMAEEKIYEYARGVWFRGIAKAKQASYAFLVLEDKKIFRVYEINHVGIANPDEYEYRRFDEEHLNTDFDQRWQFSGERDEVMEKKYQGKSVAKFQFPRSSFDFMKLSKLNKLLG